MLSESIKKRIVKSLIGEIAGLDPLQLELAGHGLVELIEDQKLIHQGINKDYKFVGYTVDTFSNGSTIIAQYSTDQDYFENEGTKEKPHFAKIENDIKGAEKHRKPDAATKIYLLSTKEEPPSFRAKFNKTRVANRLGKALNIVDAGEMAERIYELSIANQNAATFFREFFAGFSQDLDNFAYYGKLPAQCDNHQSDKAITDAIRQHFAKGQNIAVLHGVSGSGKTQAAIDFVRQESKSFESYIWLASGDWHPDVPLTAVHRSRGGAAINVVGMFNSAKTILVIDKLDQGPDEAVFKELAPGFAKGGVVIVTSQVALPGVPGHLPMPQFAKEVAIKILGEDPSKPNKNCESFVSACRFSPLLLSAARKIVESQGFSRDSFYQEILAAPEALDGDDGTSIMKRMLERLDTPLRGALAKIAQSGSTTHDGTFLSHFLGAMPRTRLQRLAILNPASAPGMLSVHDLICKVMRTDIDGRPLAAEIESFIDLYQGEMTPSILRQIHVSRTQIVAEHERRGQRAPDWLVYALLQMNDTRQVFGVYYTHKIDVTASLATLMCLIDAREQHAYSLDPETDRQPFYAACIDEYAEALKTAQGRHKAELLHHLGKAYRRTGKQNEALECFQNLLELEPGWHATHGQIAHLGASHDATDGIKAEGERSLRFLVSQILADPWEVPLRVSMAALSNLRSYYKFIRELADDSRAVEALAELIAMSALEGLDQFYDAFVAFTSMFGYRHQKICIDLAATLGDMFSVSPDSIEQEHQMSACEALANVAQAARRSGNENVWRRMSELSCEYADAVVSSKAFGTYFARGVAKAYNIAGVPQRALDAIDKIAADKGNHWILYRKAEAQLALNLPAALDTARQSLAQALLDERAKRQIAAYHDQLSQCCKRFGDLSEALEQAMLAVESSESGTYRSDLERRVEELKSSRRT